MIIYPIKGIFYSLKKSEWLMRPTYSLINLANLKFNYLNIRRKVNDAKVMAVVKADAYGHGVKEVVQKLNSLGNKKPEYFAVALPEEAVEVRKFGVKQPILVFEPFVNQQFEFCSKYNLIPTVFNDRHLNQLVSARKKYSSKKNKKSVKVHIKIDTGMNRLGIKHDKAFDYIRKVSKNKNFIIDGIYTHFATSDEKDKSFANLQLKRFTEVIKKLRDNDISYGLAHAANSGAILDMPDAYLDMVRPGISLYGYYPSLETTESIQLKPVMSLYSYAASVKELHPGESVSYGRVFTAKKKTKIISVPVGYADGINRSFTNKMECIIKGNKYPQVGRVTMDRIMFDIGNDTVKEGEKVILLGKSKNAVIDAWDWSKILSTIPYEICCNISKRVPRKFII